MPGLIEKLRTRKIVHWLLAYLAAAWLVLQIGDVLADTFAWPTLVMRVLTVLLAIGAIAAAVIAWYHGERGHQRVTAVELGMLTALLVVAGAAVALVSGFRAKDNDSALVAEETSVAVLPFVDMSEARNQEYFGDGITEEILNVLARLPGLRVPARTSSFSFKGKNAPAREIAQQLNVAYVLEGSVRRSGERVRITAQLIDARTDEHKWSETYDRNVDDVFKLQEEIARAIARALQLRIQPRPNTRLVAATTSSSAAHDLYLKGRAHWNSRHRAELPVALEFFRAAAQEDPSFAPAHAGVALAHAVLPQYLDEYDHKASAEEGKRAAERALQLDPRSAEAHAALGQIAQELEWEWDAAREHLDEALRLDPRYATAHQWRAELHLALGNFAAALAEIDRALRLDPLSSVMQNIRGLTLVELGDDEEAIKQFRSVVERDPGFSSARRNLVGVHLRLGRYDEALELVGDDQSARGLVAAVRIGRATPAVLRQFADSDLRSSISQAQLAFLYTQIGQRDSALAILNRAADTWESQLPYVVNSGWSTPLRSDPRFSQFREKVRLN